MLSASALVGERKWPSKRPRGTETEIDIVGNQLRNEPSERTIQFEPGGTSEPESPSGIANSSSAEATAIDGRDACIGLSPMQRQLWVVEQLDPGSPVHNLPVCLRIRGPLDLERLRATVDTLATRHDALRTTIHAVNGEPVTRLNEVHGTISVHDLSGVPEATREAAVESERLELTGLAFDLQKAPLVRFHLLVLSEFEHVLLVVASQLVVDEQSLGNLAREIISEYGTGATGAENLPLPAASRRLERHAGPAPLARQREYWLERLDGMPELIELPRERVRPERVSHRGIYGQSRLGASLNGRLSEIAREQGAQLSDVMLACVELVLARYSGQKDFGIGVRISGVAVPECRDAIGVHANTLVMRSELPGATTFAQLLQRVRDARLAAFENGDLVTSELVQLLRSNRERNRNPLYQATYHHRRIACEEQRVGDVSFQEEPVFSGVAITDVDFYCFEAQDCSVIGVQAAADLIGPDTLRRLTQSVCHVLSDIADAPERALDEISVISEADEHFLLHDLNQTQRPWDSEALLHRMFEAMVDEHATQVAVYFEDESITWSELDRRSNRLAHELVRRGVVRDDRVGICLNRSIELIVAMWAVLKSGAGYVPLDPHFPPDRINHVLADATARLVVSNSQIAGQLGFAADALLLDRDATLIAANSDARLEVEERSTQLAYVIYTSGSTGRPKGVMVEHRNVVSFLVGMDHAIDLHDTGTWLAATTVAFDMSVLEIIGSLSYGRPIVLLGQMVLGEVAESRFSIPNLIHRHGVTHFQCTPSQCRALLLSEAGRHALRSLKQLVLGGEPIPADLAAQLLNLLRGKLVNGYGPTETTVFSTSAILRAGEPVHIGRPIANASILVLDPNGQLVPFGSIGELCLGGPGVTRGYLGQPALTAERFITTRYFSGPQERFYRTGDLVRYLPNGNLFYLGRNDHQVKIRGFRIELEEIESSLRGVDGVEMAAVAAKGEGDEKRLVAYLVTNGNYAGHESCRERLRSRLPDYMIPGAFVELESLPMTPNGKLDRKALPMPSLQAHGQADRVPAADAFEQSVLEIWQRVLGLADLSVTSNFFELGGHSLLAVRLFDEINSRFSASLPIAILFELPTVRQLASRLRELSRQGGQARSAPPWSTVVPIQVQGERPPLFCVAGLGGNTMNLRFLAQALGPDQPFYGLQHRGVDGVLAPHRSIAAMADEFLHDIRSVQPEGPYFLAGYSTGGLAAYEMARILIESGETVGALILLDSANPTMAKWPLKQRLRAHWARFCATGFEYLWTRAAASGYRHYRTTQKLIRARLARFNRFEYRMDAVEVATAEAEREFVPTPIDAYVLLLRADFPVPTEGGIGYPPHESNGWRDMVRGTLEIVEIKCNHDDLISSRVTPTTAAVMRSALRKAQLPHDVDPPPPSILPDGFNSQRIPFYNPPPAC